MGFDRVYGKWKAAEPPRYFPRFICHTYDT
jgi:hypothetical protein